MNQKELIIKNNSFDVTIIDRNADTVEKINVNDYLRMKYICDSKEFIRFKNGYFYITEKQKQKSEVACDLLINNSMTFNRRIPLHQINNIYGLNENSSEKDLNKAISNYISNKHEYTYYCDYEIDLTVAILYHFLINGFYLRQCKNCKSVFMKENKQGVYCSECSEIQKEQTAIDKKLNQRVQSKKIYEKEFNSTRGMLDYHQDKIDNYKKVKAEYGKRITAERKRLRNKQITEEELDKFALDLHEEVKKFIEEVCNER